MARGHWQPHLRLPAATPRSGGAPFEPCSGTTTFGLLQSASPQLFKPSAVRRRQRWRSVAGIAHAHCYYFAAHQRRVRCTRAPGIARDSARRGAGSSWRLGRSSCHCARMDLGSIHWRWEGLRLGCGNCAMCSEEEQRVSGAARRRGGPARQRPIARAPCAPGVFCSSARGTLL
jgi:hypothetical protein